MQVYTVNANKASSRVREGGGGGGAVLPEKMGKTTICDIFDLLIHTRTQTRTEGAN